MTYWNRVKVVTPPAAPLDNFITLAALKSFAAIDGTDSDADLTRALNTAISMIDGPLGIGYAVLTQDWCLTLDCFEPCIHLPGAPIKSIVSVKYDDPDGAEQVLDASAYSVALGAAPVRLVPAYRTYWPIARLMPGSVRIQYRLGETTAAAVHPRLLDFVCLVVAMRDKFRESVTATPADIKEMPFGISAILDDFRQFSVTA